MTSTIGEKKLKTQFGVDGKDNTVSNDVQGIISFYDVEQREDEKIEVINPRGEIYEDTNLSCGFDKENPSKYEPTVVLNVSVIGNCIIGHV